MKFRHNSNHKAPYFMSVNLFSRLYAKANNLYVNVYSMEIISIYCSFFFASSYSCVHNFFSKMKNTKTRKINNKIWCVRVILVQSHSDVCRSFIVILLNIVQSEYELVQRGMSVVGTRTLNLYAFSQLRIFYILCV